MQYAILAYHAESIVEAFTPQEDAALMTDLLALHDTLVESGRMGPAGRLAGTAMARTLRGPADGMVIDGPFAETKEQLLGFYVVDCTDEEEALGIARQLKRVNETAVYEVRPIRLYIPGADLPGT